MGTKKRRRRISPRNKSKARQGVGQTSSRACRNTSGERQVLLLQIVILFLATVIVTSSIWTRHALLGGHSTKIDLARLVEFDAAIRAGDFFPSWSPDLYSGYGSPIFQFYAPLAYYAAEVPVLLGLDFATALKITQLLALFASGLAMYRLGVTYFSGWAACLGGLFYIVAPYRFVDVFVRHAFTEHVAFIWLPLIVWGTDRFISKYSGVGLAAGALATAALIFTHNGMALIGLPVCVAAGWAVAISSQNVHKSGRLLSWRALGAASVVPALGVGLATFFWWPAMSGFALTHSEAGLTGDYFDFHHHFVKGWQFLDPRWNFGVSAGDTGENAESSGDQMSLQIGLLHLFAGLGALAMVLGRWQGEGDNGRRRTVWALVGVSVMAIGVLMSCRWSQPLWESLPLVKYVQFPWRFLGLVVFGAAICATALTDRFLAIPQLRESASIASSAGIALILAAYFPYYSHARFLVLVRNANSLAFVSGAQLDTLQSTGALIPFGFSTSVSELRQNRESATSLDDFLPRDVKQKPAQPPTQMVVADGGRVVETAQLDQNHYRSRVQMSGTGKAELLQFWFPGWRATVDGIQVGTTPSGPQAVVSCEVPAGEHVVEFRYRGLPQRRTGIVVSIIAVAIGACALYLLRRLQEAT
jgi:hypothetical protein